MFKKITEKIGGLLLAVALIILPNVVSADETLQSKIDATQSGVVTLDKDYTDSITISADKNITINLNGHSITTSTDAISNHGKLTITGEGSVNSTQGAVVNFPGGEVVIDNGAYHSTGWYVIKNMGTMTINNLKFTNDVKNGSSLIVNGFYGNSANDRGQTYNDTKVLLTINGGTFENKNNSSSVVKNDDGGVLVINNGTFTSNSDVSEINSSPVIMNWNKATINGGTFTSVNGAVISNGYSNDTKDIGELTINGGTFTSKGDLLACNGGAKKGKGILTITGGTFSGTLNSFPSYYSLSVKGGSFSKEVTPETGYKAYQVLNSSEEKYVIASEDDLSLESIVSTLEKEQIGQSELALIEKASQNYQVAAYFNIDLAEITSDGSVVAYYDESNEKIKVTLDIPEDLEKVKDGYMRTYYIIRVHDGKTELLDTTNNNDGTISFQTDKFSTYTLVYKDVPSEVESPKTVDNILIYVITLIVSLSAVAAIGIYLKKRFN